MTALQTAYVILDVAAFVAFILTLSAVSVQAIAGRGPAMRRRPGSRARRLAR